MDMLPESQTDTALAPLVTQAPAIQVPPLPQALEYSSRRQQKQAQWAGLRSGILQAGVAGLDILADVGRQLSPPPPQQAQAALPVPSAEPPDPTTTHLSALL